MQDTSQNLELTYDSVSGPSIFGTMYQNPRVNDKPLTDCSGDLLINCISVLDEDHVMIFAGSGFYSYQEHPNDSPELKFAIAQLIDITKPYNPFQSS